MKLNQWIHNFNSLDAKNQLLVAKAIMDGLKNNEIVSSQDEYDKSISEVARLFFEKIVKVGSVKEDLANVKKTFAQFHTLSADRKAEIIKRLVSIIEGCVEDQDHEEKLKICEKEGHIMGEWDLFTWTSHEDVVIDRQLVKGYECHNREWTRKCKRCGYEEKQSYEPEEAREKRLEEERQEKINSLEKELKRLKGNNKKQD
jgi:hypothetical protein